MKLVFNDYSKMFFYISRQLSKRSKTFYYHFDHLGSFSAADLMSSGKLGLIFQIVKKVFGFHDTKNLGVSHGDEIFYLFRYVH